MLKKFKKLKNLSFIPHPPINTVRGQKNSKKKSKLIIYFMYLILIFYTIIFSNSFSMK
jgi:hypothetical protein